MNVNMSDKVESYPEGHFIGLWMALGIAIFSGFGIPLSIITDNPGFIGIGPAIGVAFGLSIGQSLENKYKKEGKIRPLTDSEKKNKKNAVTIGIITLSLGVLIFVLLLILNI
jgi:hypothetical protein